MSENDAPVIRVRGLRTRFGSTLIHDGVDLDVRRFLLWRRVKPIVEHKHLPT